MKKLTINRARALGKETINRARALGKDMNAKGIVILAFGPGGEIEGRCYARTREDREQLYEWLGDVYDAIMNGEIKAPFSQETLKQQTLDDQEGT